jgi:methyl-accepting chemotaxis protein PixJ
MEEQQKLASLPGNLPNNLPSSVLETSLKTNPETSLPQTSPKTSLPQTSSGTSLRTRLLQTILPVVLLPLILASTVGYRIIAQRTESRVQQQLADQALLASEGTTAVLDELLDLPRSIADSPLVVNEAKAGSLEAVSSGLDKRAIDDLEEEFADSKLLRRHNALNAYLEKTVETAEISEISVTDSHGFNVAYSHPTTDFVQSDEAWWQNGKENQQWIGPPDFDYASKGFTVELVQAIRDPMDDSFVGIVRAVLPTRKFSLLADYLKRTGISGSQRVQLIDGGTLKTIDTFSTQGFYKDREIIGAQPVEQFITAFIEATEGKGKSADQVLSALKSKGSVSKVSLPLFDEKLQMASFTSQDRQYKIAKIPNSNWVAIASMDESEIAAAGRDSLRFLSLFTLLLAGLTTGLIFWLARQLSDPLGRLTKQAAGLSAGNFDLAVEPTGTVETKFLTETFNQLAVKVKDLLNDQRTETRKAQIFADITGSPVTALADIEPLVALSVQEALDILKADRVAFYPVGDHLADFVRQVVVRSHIPELEPTNHSGLSHWLPANRSLFFSPSDQMIVFNDTAVVEVDEHHRQFLKAMSVQSSLSVPVFNEPVLNESTLNEANEARGSSEPQLLGYFIAHHCRLAHVWQPDEIAFMQQLAAQIKLMVDRVTATENVRRSRSESQDSRQQAATIARQQQQQASAFRRQEESLQQQIAVLTREIEGVSRGDLTVRAQVSESKLKTVVSVFNATVAKLEELVTQIQRSTRQVETVFAHNEQAAVELTDVARQQRQEAAKTMESLQAVYDTMDSVVDMAQEASQGARQVAEKAEAGAAAIGQTSDKIQLLNQSATIAVKRIEQLVRSVQNVSYMTAMISDIAAEMQLLAGKNLYADGQAEGLSEKMSAAMSAEMSERDREISRSMAKMAQLSERAVSEAGIIDSFLNSTQQISEQIAQAMAQINQQVNDSNQSVVSSQQNLSEVLAISRQFEQVAQSVSEAARTQPQVTQGAANLIKAAVNLSEQTTQVSEEMAESLQQAIGSTRTLQNSVSVFKVSS